MAEPTTVFFQGDFRPLTEATISIRSKALNYGLGCFEGIRAYWNDAHGQLYLFRIDEHYKRLKESCNILHLNLPHTVEAMIQITKELCRRNSHRQDIYVRPLVFINTETLAPAIGDGECEFGLYTLPLREYLDTSNGVTACVSSWRRVSDNMIPARAKPTAAYLNSALAQREAKANGYDEAILLTDAGFVAEASAEHIFILRRGKLVTPATQDDNLEGITQRTIAELVPAELGIEVIQRRVSRTELYVAEEAFLCGTGAEVAPLVMIDKCRIGDGKVGPVTKRLKDLYFQVVRAEATKYAGWCQPVYT